MHSELWRVILHLLQGICHRATGTLFIAFTSDLPLLRAQPSARPLHLGRRIKEMPSRCYCCRDSRPRPFGGGGDSDRWNLLRPLLHSVLAAWCQALASACSARLSLVRTWVLTAAGAGARLEPTECKRCQCCL